MSAESDLLFAHPDSLMFPDFAHLPEFEDFTKDLPLSNAIDDITGGEMTEDLDCKDDLMKPLLIPELHVFSTLLEGAKDVEKPNPYCRKAPDNPFTSIMNGPSQSMAFLSTNSSSKVGMPTSGALSDRNLELLSIITGSVPPPAEHVEIPSPGTMLATNKMNCMSLEDIQELESEIALAASSFSPFGHVTQGLVPATSSAETIKMISPSSALQNSSPVSSSSSTITTTDGSCNGATPITAHSLLSKIFAQEENSNIHIRNSSIAQSSVTDTSGVFGRPSCRADASGTCRGPIPLHLIQEASQLRSIQRSRSSHALGQLGDYGHEGASSEELCLSPAGGLEITTPGLSTLGPYGLYQVSDSRGLDVRSPTTSMRRVYSTGDIQTFNAVPQCYGGDNIMTKEQSNIEEAGGLKIGHYTVEERKVKLDRYRQKRNERNFNKKIKYACRKTLADSRHRIRGRFARADDIGELMVKENGTHHDEEYEEGGDLLVTLSCLTALEPDVGILFE